jgi:hypothetical protein
VLGIGGFMFVEPLGIASQDEFRNNDWLNTRSFDLLTRRALLQDGEFPLRTHLLGGGFPVVAHPSDGSWAPTILPVLAFGDVIGVKINILIFLFLGSWGVWLLARERLGFGWGSSLFSAALFALSGWLPSMLLVGFYNQVFFLVAPLVLYLLLSSVGRVDRILAAGFLLALALQQGGHAFPALCFFCGVACWAAAASEGPKHEGTLARWGGSLGLLLLITAAPAFARGMNSTIPFLIGWGVAVAWLALSPSRRDFARRLIPWGARLGLLLLVTCSLGAARLVGLSMLSSEGSYEHRLQRYDALWFPSPHDSPAPEERFYTGPVDFLQTASGRVPAEMEYGLTWGRAGDPTGHEYAYLGLTPFCLALALGGLVLLFRVRHRAWITVIGLLFTGVCFGWKAPPDLHFLLTWGIPPLDAFSQPIKYWNFFVLLTFVLAAGASVEWITERLAKGPIRNAGFVILFLLLLWPWIQNGAIYNETFSVVRPAPPPEEFQQVMTVGDPSWAEMSLEDIRKSSDSLHLRDYTRPIQGTEYFNIRRGVGTVDWYGSLVMAQEHVAPKTFLALEGEVVPNPSYRGEVWLEPSTDAGTILNHHIGHNRLNAEIELNRPARAVFNQQWLEGFETNLGSLEEDDGLISVSLPAGKHSLSVVYKPRDLIFGLYGSAISLFVWSGVWIGLRRRRRVAQSSNSR